MEILDSSHSEYADNQNYSSPAFSTGVKGAIYLSVSLGQLLKLKQDTKNYYLHFVADVDRLYFYINNEKTGARLSYQAAGNLFRANNIPLLRLVESKVASFSIGKKYPVRKSNNKIQDYQLWEILIHNKVTNKIK